MVKPVISAEGWISQKGASGMPYLGSLNLSVHLSKEVFGGIYLDVWLSPLMPTD